MNRNVEQHFQTIPHVDIPRSRFDMSFSHKTTMNEGDLVPIGVKEILPGDSMTCKISTLMRMMTPIVPVADGCHVDIYAFFVPNRLVWNHWEEFCGANKSTYWTQPTSYTIPQLTSQSNPGNCQFWKGSLGDYMGLPTNVDMSISALPFRCYCKIYNDWFWNQNLFEPLELHTDDVNRPIPNKTNSTGFAINRCELGGAPVKVGRVADYFSGCLPAPQKGQPAMVPLGNEAPLIFKTPTSLPTGTTALTALNNKELAAWGEYYDGNPDYVETRLLATDGTAGNLHENKAINLVADLSQAIGTTVTNLRNSFAVQRMLEQRARSGSRYIEILNSMFGVQSSDARLQRAEYLGGYRAQINMTQVAQTSASGTSPQGNMAAYSLTVEQDEVVNKSFEEHGHVLFLACIRIDRSYQQGIERFWSRKDFVDYYLPVFANLSEMAVLNKEIYAQGTSQDEEVFGYQECWADYRYSQNRISGELRSTYATPLDMYHYGDKYNSLPILGRAWFEEDKSGIQRTLAVQNHDQFICDFYFDLQMNRPMPVYSVPGLLDHN